MTFWSPDMAANDRKMRLNAAPHRRFAGSRSGFICRRSARARPRGRLRDHQWGNVEPVGGADIPARTGRPEHSLRSWTHVPLPLTGPAAGDLRRRKRAILVFPAPCHDSQRSHAAAGGRSDRPHGKGATSAARSTSVKRASSTTGRPTFGLGRAPASPDKARDVSVDALPIRALPSRPAADPRCGTNRGTTGPQATGRQTRRRLADGHRQRAISSAACSG